MRTAILPFLAFVFYHPSDAQTCAGYYLFSKGDVEMTTFDAKGKEDGKVTFTVAEITKSGEDFMSSFVSESKNKSGTSLSKVPGKYRCSNGSLFLDAAVAAPREQMAPYKDMDIQSSAYVEYPARLVVNQTFRDTSFGLQVLNAASLYRSITLNVSNRRVATKETLLNRTGNWECYKITYDGKFTATDAAGISTVYDYKCAEWFAPGFGIVKSETYSPTSTMVSSFGIFSKKYN